MGGVNLLPMTLLADVEQLVHGWCLLQSSTVGSLSHTILQAVVEKRIRTTAQPSDLVDYLNGRMDGNFANESTDVTNVWTRLRPATVRIRRKLNVEWSLNAEQQPQLQLNGFRLRASEVEHSLQSAAREYFRRRLLNKPDQGKVYEVTSAATPPNHFMRNGNFTRFAEWIFIHRARLDCVPLNGARRFGRGDKRCRRCGHENETLPHVLNHCKTHLAAITHRHNSVLDRLVKALVPRKGAAVRVNQCVPGMNDGLRPDLLIVNEVEKSAAIIDVATPFENRCAAFEAARNKKRTKYGHTAEEYRRRGYDVHIDAFIVGSLGGGGVVSS
jgi:ribosomal protein S14